MAEEISFGVWLRKQRRALDLTRQAFADEVGCAEVTLRRIEAGTLKPSKELAGILLERLGVPETEYPRWIAFARGLSGFPSQSLPSSTTPKSNLPASLTTFIGREKEQADIMRLLTKHRLVTLTGSGGIGKTRLSIKVGEQILGNYADGVWLLELASLSDAAFLSRAAAALFVIKNQSNVPFTDLLVNFMNAKSMLLILDNCEHLLNACAYFTDILLKSCPHLKIMATSREPLGITGEAIYRVPSLAIPDFQQILDAFREFESINLFEERAQLAQFDFALTMENASFVAEICYRLDGIPLAIELAAAKVELTSMEQMARQLDESFNLLTGGSRTDLPHHQTLRASMNWSWGLLTEPEQTLMRQLAVFASGWTLEASQLVCDGDVLELTNSLVKKSLIEINQEVGRETRYRFHETIRQYAHEKLLESGEDKQVRSRHLDYFLKLVQRSEPELYRADQIEWMHKLEAENENIRAALEWSLQGDLTLGQELAGTLWRFWIVSWNLTEGYEWMERMLRLSSGDKSFVRAKLLAVYGDVAYCLGYSEKAEKVSEESITLFRELGQEAGMALPLTTLGRIAGEKTEYEKMTQLLNMSLDISRRAGDRWEVFFALSILGFHTMDHEDFSQGQQILEECLLICKEIGDREGVAYILSFLAGRIAMQGNFARAMKMYEEVLEFEKLLSRRVWITEILTVMGHLASYMGDYQKGRLLLQEAMELYEKIGDRAGIGRSLRYLGWTARLEGDYLKAQSLYTDCLQLSPEKTDVDSWLIHIGNLMYVQGFPEKFVRLFGAVEKTVPEILETLLPLFSIETKSFIEHARTMLGEVAFSKAYEEGQKLTLDEAVAYALEEC